MNLSGRRPGEPDADDDDQISPEKRAWRIGATDVRPVQPAVEAPGPAPDAAPAGVIPTSAPHSRPSFARPPGAQPSTRPVVGATTRRIVLWRDASALLFGIVAVVLIAQLAIGNRGDAAASTPPGGVSAGSSDLAVRATNPAGESASATLGPVIDPGLIPAIEATPTPAPGPTPRPTPRLTPRPTRTASIIPKSSPDSGSTWLGCGNNPCGQCWMFCEN